MSLNQGGVFLKMKIPLSKPDIGETEITNVVEVLRSGRLSLGPKVEEFEQKFAFYAGTKYAVATNSGTSALHLGVRALGIGPDDEVITTPFSFVASTNCILYESAEPVFVDIDPVTMNLDVAQLRRFLEEFCTYDSRVGMLLNKETGRVVKALLPVHVFGLPSDMTAICELARHYNLRVIEDACEALGAEHHGRRVGTFGDVAVFAFYPNKQMTTGEGGMLVTDSEAIANLCRSLRNQGRDNNTAWLSHGRLGYNYRLSELHSALGIAQLERIDELLASRERVAESYKQALARVPYLILPQESAGNRRSWFVFVVQLDVPDPRAMRDRIMKTLRERGIECQAYFPAIHTQPYMAAYVTAPLGLLKNTELASDRSLAIPFFPSMSSEEITVVARTLESVMGEEISPQEAGLGKSATGLS
jgi:perosamine synthetase